MKWFNDVLMMSMNLSDIDILNICGIDQRCISTRISKYEGVNLIQNPDLSKKVNHYKI